MYILVDVKPPVSAQVLFLLTVLEPNITKE